MPWLMQRTSSPMTEMAFAMLCCLASANISAGDLATTVLACHCLWTGMVPTSQTAVSMRSQDTMHQGLCMCQGQVSQPEMSKQLFFPSGGAFVSMVKKMYYHKCCLWAQSWIKTKQTLNPAKFQQSPLQKHSHPLTTFFFQEPVCFQRESWILTNTLLASRLYMTTAWKATLKVCSIEDYSQV